MTAPTEKAAPIPAEVQALAENAQHRALKYVVFKDPENVERAKAAVRFEVALAIRADREARPSLPDSREEQDGFNRGYLIAVANVMNMHRDAVVASELLVQLGVTIDDAEALGLTDYDMDALKRLRSEPRAAPFFKRKRRARARQGGNNG